MLESKNKVKKDEVALLSVIEVKNYGTMLQTYALQQALCNLKGV